MEPLHPEVERLRAHVIEHIASIMKGWDLGQVEAAKRLGVTQARASGLLRKDTRVYSLEGLVRLADRLDLDVSLTVKKRRGGKAKASQEPSE